MRNDYRFRSTGYSWSGYFPLGVKWLLISNTAIFVLCFLFPDRIVLMSFLFPIKAKYFVMIIGGIAFLNSVGSAGSGVSNVAHLGGMLFGYLYLRMGFLRLDAGKLIQRYQEWKLQRAKRKFQVYMRKQNKRGPWVN